MSNVATKITVSPTNAVLPLGETLQLTASLTDINGNAVSPVSAFTWTGSNPALAAVDRTGLVTAAEPIADQLNVGGQVSISVKYPYGFADAIEATCVLQITVPEAYSGHVVILEKNATVAHFGDVGVFPVQPFDGRNPVIGG